MDQSNNPVSNLSYIPAEHPYPYKPLELGITDLLTQPDPEMNTPASGPVDYVQKGLEDMRKLKPDYQTINQSSYFDYKGTNAARYVGSTNYNVLGFDPELGRENEYKYGEMQTTGDMFGNAFAGAGRLAASTFVDGWKGWGRMADALFSWDSSKLMGDPDELYKLNEDQKAVMDKYAIYQTPESEKSVFNRQLLGDMIQQSGFALGTTAQFLSEELLTMGLSSAFSLTKMGLTSGAKFARGAYQLGELTADAKKLGDIWKADSIVKKIYDGAKKFVPLVGTIDDVTKAGKAGASALQMASIGLGGIKRSLAEMNMAMTEARMEAAGTYGDLYDKMYNDIVAKTGQVPVGQDLERIKELSLAAAEDNFKVNTGVLAVMNRIQFDNLFSKFGSERKILQSLGQYGDDVLSVSGKIGNKAATRVYKKGITGAVGAAADIAADFGKKKAAWEITKSLGKGLSKWEVSEGVQELIQEGSNVALQDYYYDLYSGKPADMGKSVNLAAESQYSQQGFKTFMMGALTGRLISPITGGLGKAVEYSRTTDEQRKTRNADFKESLGLINEFYKNPNKALNEAIANFNVQNKAAETMEEALAQRDEYVYHNTKDSAFAKMVSAAKKMDHLESVLDTIREYGNHLDEQQLKEAFPTVDPTENNITNAREYFNKIANEVEQFHKNWELLNDKYGDLVRPELYQDGSEDQMIALKAKKALQDSIEILATNKFKAARAVERAQKIYNQVQEDSNIGQSSAYAFRTMSNDKSMQKEIDILTGEILSMSAGEGPISKETKELIKKKNAELEALLEYQKHWNPEMENQEANQFAVLNTPALKKAYTDYINARNASSDLSTTVSLDQLDNSWAMFMDYANLNKDHQDYVDAFNTLANPGRFVQMFDAKREAIGAVMEKMRREAAEEAQELNTPVAGSPEDTAEAAPEGEPKGPVNPEGPGPDAPAGGQPAEGEKKTRHYVVQLSSGRFVVYSPAGKEASMPFDTKEEAEEEAATLDEMILGIKPNQQPAQAPQAPAAPVTPQGVKSEEEKEIDSLNLKDVDATTLQKAAKAVKKIYDKIFNNDLLVEKLKAKILTVKDAVFQNSLMQIVTGKTSDGDGYKDINNGTKNHVGRDLENIKQKDAYNGLAVFGKDQDLINQIASGTGELNNRVRITASTTKVTKNIEQANSLNIPNRTAFTYETPDQVAKLKTGQSVLAMGAKTNGVMLDVLPKSGNGTLGIGGLDNYYIIHPDNTTEPVTFENHQKSFIMANLLVDGENMTEAQFMMYQANYNHYQQFQNEALELLNGAVVGDVTELFNKYFTLSPAGIAAVDGESMDNVFTNNPERLFDMSVRQEDGTIVQKKVPLIAMRLKDVWKMEFVTPSGEEVVDEEGNSIDRVEKYVRENFGIKPTFGPGIPPYVWIANAPSASSKHFLKFLTRDSGTKPVEGYKAFLMEFDALQQAIQAGAANRTYNYDGRVFTSENELMTYFNTNKFGFFTAGDWFVDLSYSPKSDANPFNIELRPKNTKARRSLTADQKKALNIFFSAKELNNLISTLKSKGVDDQEVVDNYNKWIKSLLTRFDKMVTKLSESSDPALKSFADTINVSTLFYYEKEGDTKNYLLKLKAKTEGSSVAPLLVYQGASNNVSGINISFNDTPVAAKPAQKAPKPAAPSGPVVFGDKVSADQYGTDADGLVTFEGKTIANQIRNPKTNPQRLPTQSVIKRHLNQRLFNELGKLDIGQDDMWDNFMVGLDFDDDSVPYLTIQDAQSGDEMGALNVFIARNKTLLSDGFVKDVEALLEKQNLLRSKYDQAFQDAVSGKQKNDVPAQAPVTPSAAGTDFVVNLNDDFVPDADPFMLEDGVIERYTENTYNEEINWLLKNANLQSAGVKIQDLLNIIEQISAGKEILGYYRNKVIYVNKVMSAKGTLYHEAFHALFRDVLNSKDRKFYLDRAKAKLGSVSQEKIDTFRNERKYFNKSNEQIVDLMAEELLADGFRDYKLNKKEPADGWFKRFVKWLDRVFNFLQRDEIQDLYRDFDAGTVKSNRNAEANIADEGVFELASGRPMLTLRQNEAGVMEIRRITDPRFLRPLNMEVQKEVVNRLTRLVSNKNVGSFNERFQQAVQELKEDYNIENLVAQNPDAASAIRNKYGTFFDEAYFILGGQTGYDLDESLAGNEQAQSLKIPVGSLNERTLNIVKAEVNSKINSLGLSAGWASDEYFIPETDDEDQAESDKGGEFDTIHMNPLGGISREFRSLFSLISYTEKDEELGVKINRVADGNMLFNAVIKVASDRPVEEILPALQLAVEALEEDGDRKAIQLRALTDELSKQFGISDLSDKTAKPSKNIFLHKQFLDTFFVTELAANVVVVSLDEVFGANTSMYDASLNKDIATKKESIAYVFDRAYKKIRTDEQKLEFSQKFTELKEFIKGDLNNFLNQSNVSNRKILNEFVDELYDKMAAVNIVLPKLLLRRSLQAIYTVERDGKINANSKKTLQELEADQSLIKQGAYLQWTFFDMMSQIDNDQVKNIFSDTRDESVVLTGNNQANIEGVNGVLKKAVRMILKYDINSAIPVFQNAENANIWRYSRYTPPILLAQMVRERGVDSIIEMYPVLGPFLKENPLFDGSIENELLIKNLFIEAFNGFREEIDGVNQGGVTFGSIDTRSLMISNLVSFMKRETISTNVKNEKGKLQQHKIVTFKRSRTQEEATTTNFMVTARYKKYVDGTETSNEFFDDITKFFEQEYNRIAREWAQRDDDSVVRYKNFNDSDKGRAYTFHNLYHFFNEPSMTEVNKDVRSNMRSVLIDAAKNGVPFNQAIDMTVLRQQLSDYVDSTLQVYRDRLVDSKIITERTSQKGDKYTTSNFLGTKVREDFKDHPMKNKGYDSYDELIKDHHLNTFINKLMVNQIFDGDIAMGIKSAQEYYKRNKAGVISGNSMKRGYFRTAVVDNLKVFLNEQDLTQETLDVAQDGLTAVDVADGQSYHTMNHRIRMMDAWGRLTPSVRAILNAYKYRSLTKDEIEELENAKVVLNTIKTATGGVLEYYKLSEHLVSRVDVSYLNPAKGTEADAHAALDILYTRIEQLEDQIVENPTMENLSQLENQLNDLYNEVHEYWLPRRNRVKLHHMLNSMEKSGVDQLFDPNASKKTTLVPVTLNSDATTDLKASKSYTSGLFKFMQVETSGIKKEITDPSQTRQLISTYLNQLENEKLYNKYSLADLAKQYESVLADITKANHKILDTSLYKDGQLDISSVYKMMRKGLAEQGADSNTLKFFDLEDGKPVHNVNLPMIKKQFTYYFFALYNQSVYSPKIAGRSDILVSQYGYDVIYDRKTGKIITSDEYMSYPSLYEGPDYGTRHLGVSQEINKDGKLVYTVEVIIPKHLSENKEEEKFFLDNLNKFFSTRIPTEDKRSMIVAKVVDYMDSAYQNSIVVPQLVHILAGSDLDVDKLYSHTVDYYRDFNGKQHVYGDYSAYSTESKGKFIEYIYAMMKEPTLRDMITEQIETVSANPVVPAAFAKLKEELGLADMTFSKEELVDRRKALEHKRAALADQWEKDRIALDTAYNILKESGYSEDLQSPFQRARAQYLFIKEQQRQVAGELKEIKEEIRKMGNSIKLLATYQVLASNNFPTSQSGLTEYIKKNGNPVTGVLQNEKLQIKMDILSHQYVFNNQYIKEKSDVAQFENIALAIGADIDDVVNMNSIYSVMGDVVANELNSSNKDGIGITASFNKFLAFAQKNNLVLPKGLKIYNEKTGQVDILKTFQSSDAIRKTGAILGMFADAAKKPIPSVINLNPETAHVSNMMNALGAPLEMALLINKLPFIEAATKEVINSESNAKIPGDYKVTMDNYLAYTVLGPIYEKLEEEDRLGELFVKDKDGNMKMRNLTLKAVDISPDAATKKDATIGDFGFSVLNDKGDVVAEDVASYFLATTYLDLLSVKGDVLSLGRILNLIKKQKPEFLEMDKTVNNISMFLNAKKGFKAEIGRALASSVEYKPLMNVISSQSANASELLLERSPLFLQINNSMVRVFDFDKMTSAGRNNINQQFIKFIIANRTKADMRDELAELKANPKSNPVAIRSLEDAMKLFTSEFWIDNESEMMDRLEYLYDNHPGNPFVEFLKMTKTEGISFFEASSRMKLDKDIAESIILGYEALQKSLDPETKILSRFLFYYLLVKDGLGYSNNSFLTYISPDLKQYRAISDVLSVFHDEVKAQSPVINKAKRKLEAIDQSGISPEAKELAKQVVAAEITKFINGSFDKLFKNTSGKTVNWMDQLMRKVFTNAGNQKFHKEIKGIATKNGVRKELDAAIEKGLFGNHKPSTKGYYVNPFEETRESYDFDFSNVTGSKQMFDAIGKMGMMSFIDEETGENKGVYFPLVVKSGNRLYKLVTIDGNPMTNTLSMNILTGNSDGFTGFKGEYKELLVEGTEKLNNFAFTNKEGAAINQYAKSVSAKTKADKSTAFVTKTGEAIPFGGDFTSDTIEIVKVDDVESLLKKNKPAQTTDQSTQTEPAKLKGQMTFEYGDNKRADVKANSTFDAILSGERTATTRYASQKNIEYWKQAKVGDIITWESADGRTLDVEVTKALSPLVGSGKTAEQWSKLEGWSKEYFEKNVRPMLDQAWQMEYKLVGPVQATTQVSAQSLLSKGEIMDLYRVKDRDETLRDFTNRVNEFIATLGKAVVSKQEIIDQLKSCL